MMRIDYGSLSARVCLVRFVSLDLAHGSIQILDQQGLPKHLGGNLFGLAWPKII